MSRRFKSSTFKFNQPLSMPESKVVYRCYATHGKAYVKDPPQDSRIQLLCFSETRKVKWADGLYTWQEYQCD